MWESEGGVCVGGGGVWGWGGVCRWWWGKCVCVFAAGSSLRVCGVDKNISR